MTHITHIEDFLRNVAGIDEHWLENAHPRLVKAALRDLRNEARAILDAPMEAEIDRSQAMLERLFSRDELIGLSVLGVGMPKSEDKP